MSTLGPCLATADVNGDGKDDFYLGGAAGKSGQLFLQNDMQAFDLNSKEPWSLHKAQEDLDALFLMQMVMGIRIFMWFLAAMNLKKIPSFIRITCI